MASIGEDIVTWLKTVGSITTSTSNRIHQNHMPERSEYPAIWFMRASENEELTLDGAGGLINTRIDLECLGETIDAAIDLADAVKAKLHGFAGVFGTKSARGMFVEDKDDDYIPRSAGADDGISVVALDVSVWHTT